MSNNPLYDTHEKIWAVLEADTTFATDVKTNNRRKDCVLYEPPHKDTLAEADTPEVAVVLRGVTTHMRTSNGRLMDFLFDIGIQTHSRSDDSVLDVVWSIYRAINDWDPESDSVTWQDVQFKWDVYIDETDKEAVRSGMASYRGGAGWFSVVKIVVQCYFSNSSIASY